MDKDIIEVVIDGVNYYVNSRDISSISFIDGQLVNTSSQYSVTFKHSYGDNTTYPYIRCSSQQVCRLYNSNTSNYKVVTSDLELKSDYFKVVNYDLVIIFLLFIILGLKLVWKR